MATGTSGPIRHSLFYFPEQKRGPKTRTPRDLTVTAGAATIDLTALTGTNGVTIDGTGLKVQAIKLANKAANANAMTLSIGASNGYDGWGANFEVDIAAGAEVVLFASLYEAFAPDDARRLRDRLEIHYTPTHGSWLNVAEIELSLLTRMALNRRVGNIENLRHQSQAWANRRNCEERKVDWQFRTDHARIKLKRLYPEYRRS